MPGLADERHELRLGLMSGPIEGVSEQRELPLTPDERGVDPTGDVDAVVGSRLERLPDRDRRRLPLRLHGIGRSVLDRSLRGAERRLADQDPVDRSGGLEPRRRVHHVARGHPLAFEGADTERDERLPRVHADPHVEVQVRILLVHLRHRVADRQRGPDGALGVVLVRRRSAEDRHHRVADELLDRPAAALELLPEPREVRA